VSIDEATLIYDGDCRLCQASVNWIRLKLDIAAEPFQRANLERFGLTRDECAKEVVVHTSIATYRGAEAVAYLLRSRGNRLASFLITASGPLGRAGYNWVATHRNSAPIKLLTRFLERQR
jgi:predicted DCC family thiol-disulfide oxidoreductase YuxK